MKQHKLGNRQVSAIGIGCMNVSWIWSNGAALGFIAFGRLGDLGGLLVLHRPIFVIAPPECRASGRTRDLVVVAQRHRLHRRAGAFGDDGD